MSNPRNRYPELGEPVLHESVEAVVRRMKALCPNAHAEGSTGAERTWFFGRGNLIAHHWPKNPKKPFGPTYLRGPKF